LTGRILRPFGKSGAFYPPRHCIVALCVDDRAVLSKDRQTGNSHETPGRPRRRDRVQGRLFVLLPSPEKRPNRRSELQESSRKRNPRYGHRRGVTADVRTRSIGEKGIRALSRHSVARKREVETPPAKKRPIIVIVPNCSTRTVANNGKESGASANGSSGSCQV